MKFSNPFKDSPNRTITLLFNMGKFQLFIAIATMSTLAFGATSCPPGFKLEDSTCRKCPAGTYSSDGRRCWSCPSNSFSRFPGAVHSSLCLPCPPNSFSPLGATNCTRCPNGFVRGIQNCLRCKPGTRILRSKCVDCFPAQFTDVFNAAECMQCPGGYKATADRRGCVEMDCPPGTGGEGVLCKPCRDGLFSNVTGGVCTTCPADEGWVSATKCKKCRPGTFLKESLRSQIRQCRKCPKGKSTNGWSKPICRTPGQPCQAGFRVDGDDDCVRCSRVERFDEKLKRCVPCGDMDYANDGVSEVCEKCMPGQTRDPKYGSCRCKAGKEVRRGRCRPCLPGYASDFGAKCHRCDDFSYSSGFGAKNCKACPFGSGSATTRGKSCMSFPKCDAGFVSGVPGQNPLDQYRCISGRTGCPKGLKFSGLQELPGFKDELAYKILCTNEKKKLYVRMDTSSMVRGASDAGTASF